MAGETGITVIGNLTDDPELRYTQNGIALANFTIASTPRVWSKQANDWEDGETLFLRGTVWREYAEHVAATLSKGTRVIAHGTLKQRSYQTKEGEKRTAYELDVEEIGPALRYVSGTLVKTGSRTQAANQQSARADESDVWSTADIPNSDYTDETPF